MLNQLTMIKPRVTDALGLREMAFVAIGLGGIIIASIGPALALFGRRGAHAKTVVKARPKQPAVVAVPG